MTALTINMMGATATVASPKEVVAMIAAKLKLQRVRKNIAQFDGRQLSDLGLENARGLMRGESQTERAVRLAGTDHIAAMSLLSK